MQHPAPLVGKSRSVRSKRGRFQSFVLVLSKPFHALANLAKRLPHGNSDSGRMFSQINPIATDHCNRLHIFTYQLVLVYYLLGLSLFDTSKFVLQVNLASHQEQSQRSTQLILALC